MTVGEAAENPAFCELDRQILLRSRFYFDWSPSMHAAVAIIVPYTLRWNRWLFWPITALDAVMLSSAVPSGNHYLADVMAGVAVGALAIACGRAFQTSLDRLFSNRRDFDYARQRAYNS